MDKHYVLIAIGERIRDLRKNKGLSQEELGEKAGFHFSYIGGVERAEKNISILNLEKIATSLDTTIADLFSYTTRKRGKTEKDRLLNQIHVKLHTLTAAELIKVNNIINEIFDTH
ncbi:helix-turn-helix domain-containing protein [Paenibacillus sp. CC-CFT747]|nr:helix-turn-helix domain-containing protein [Paenibacillus sp. CC-CFT747]